MIEQVANAMVIAVGGQYLAMAVMYASVHRWGLALTFFAYALANAGLYLEARL